VQAPSATELRLVRETFDRLRPAADFLASQFYQRLFQLAPDTKFLFKRSSGEQYRMLMFGLATLVREADNPDKFAAFAQTLAVSHAAFGVTPDHYKPAAQALLDTLQQGLGTRYTPEVKSAWNSLCVRLFDEMKKAVAGHER
jgi:nitric oxide dioxygenase